MSKGIITCLIAGEYTIFDNDKNEYFKGKPRGLFRIKEDTLKVGDSVDYEIQVDQVVITNLHKRTNELVRPSISNIDQAFVVFSVKEPDINFNLLDRFITILEFSNIEPIIVLNKWDLLNKEEEIKTIEVKQYYEKIGYRVIQTSAKQGFIEQLKDLIKDHVSVITGQSGVGKSSLLNELEPTLNITTNEISKALNRGKHTTRHVELISMLGGWIADTPGFGIMDFIDMDEYDISHSFVEFFELSKECKYNGCLHLNEPKCAVKEAIESGNVLASRYENYKQFLEEIKNRKKW